MSTKISRRSPALQNAPAPATVVAPAKTLSDQQRSEQIAEAAYFVSEPKSSCGPSISRYGVVGVEALNHLLQPSALLRCRLVSSPPQLLLHPLKRCLHVVTSSASLNKEAPFRRRRARHRTVVLTGRLGGGYAEYVVLDVHARLDQGRLLELGEIDH
jgi:hypothetical protein